MSKTTHLLYLAALVVITVITVILVAWYGLAYYTLDIGERFFHAAHNNLKPSGSWGHGYGIIGSLLMLLGVALYMARKRSRFLAKFGLLRHWLEFHIFLCTLGPFLVLFHTSFKFGGLVAISFWSMVAVFLSGIIGRFIYIQIPRTIEGREMSLAEIRQTEAETGSKIRELKRLDPESLKWISDPEGIARDRRSSNLFMRYMQGYLEGKRKVGKISKELEAKGIDREHRKELLKLIRNELTVRRKIENLVVMQDLFRYWHVAHLPFALVMLVIMIIHVAVTIVFGYRWIF